MKIPVRDRPFLKQDCLPRPGLRNQRKYQTQDEINMIAKELTGLRKNRMIRPEQITRRNEKTACSSHGHNHVLPVWDVYQKMN